MLKTCIIWYGSLHIAIVVVDAGAGEMMQEGEGGMVAMDNIGPALIPC